MAEKNSKLYDFIKNERYNTNNQNIMLPDITLEKIKSTLTDYDDEKLISFANKKGLEALKANRAITVRDMINENLPMPAEIKNVLIYSPGDDVEEREGFYLGVELHELFPVVDDDGFLLHTVIPSEESRNPPDQFLVLREHILTFGYVCKFIIGKVDANLEVQELRRNKLTSLVKEAQAALDAVGLAAARAKEAMAEFSDAREKLRALHARVGRGDTHAIADDVAESWVHAVDLANKYHRNADSRFKEDEYHTARDVLRERGIRFLQ